MSFYTNHNTAKLTQNKKTYTATKLTLVKKRYIYYQIYEPTFIKEFIISQRLLWKRGDNLIFYPVIAKLIFSLPDWKKKLKLLKTKILILKNTKRQYYAFLAKMYQNLMMPLLKICILQNCKILSF